MNIPLICIGILGLLTIGLGLGVSLNRRSSKRSVGVPDDPTSKLLKYSRAHGNTVEYAPMLALLIWILAETGASGWVHWVMLGATVSRVLIVAGLVLPASLNTLPNPARFYGALGTYVFGLTLAVLVLIQSF